MNEIEKLERLTKRYLTEYDYANVSKTCDRLLEINPESSFALRFNGISYLQRNNYKKAIAYYEKLLEINPEDNQVKYTLAFLNEKTGNHEGALSYYDKINDDYLDERRNRLLTKMKRYDTIIRHYDKKIASLRQNSKCYDARILVLLEEKAVFCYRNGECEEAYRIFREISEHYPEVLKSITHPMKRCEAWYNTLEYYLEKHEKPEEFFNAFLKLGTKDNGWTNKLKRNISYGDPYVFADILIEKNPENIDLLECYGNFAEYRYYEYSLKCFHKILETQPDNKNAIDKIITIYSREYLKDRALAFIDSKMHYPHLRPGLLERKIELLESMLLYPEALHAYNEYLEQEKDRRKTSSMKSERLVCMELYALDLYNQDRPEQSYNILKETYSYYKKIGNTRTNELTSDWYTNVLKEAIDKSKDSYKEFFKHFHHPDAKQTSIWIRKIDSITPKFKVQKDIGNVSYQDILLEENGNNLELAISEARKYYFGIQRPRIALPLYENVLRIDPHNREVLNHKFSMLVTDRQYEQAYDLLLDLDIDYPVIAYSLEHLADILINKKEYEKAKYCVNLLLKEKWDYKGLKKLKYLWQKTGDTYNRKRSQYYMDWINLIKCRHDKNICPHCKNGLIPVRYGVIFANDLGLKNGQYYASENIITKKHRPTDYCPKCKEEHYMGMCGIELNEDDARLADYTKEIIIWLTKYLENNPERTMKEIEKVAYWEFSLDYIEFRALTEKLEQINYIKRKDEHLKLNMNYAQFKHSIKEKYHLGTKIFENKRQMEEYSRTITKGKKYSCVEEYVEDIKICLMSSSWKYDYERATELLKGDETYLDYEDEPDAWDVAMEVGYVCG